MGSKSPVAFVGLGAMGILMSAQLLSCSFPVIGYDVNPASLRTLIAVGGSAAVSPAEAARSADVVIFMVATADQLTSALFADDTGVVHGLRKNAAVIIQATVAPSFPSEVRTRLNREFDRQDVILVDAPVSGGTKRAADGTLSIIASSGQLEDIGRADVKDVLRCMAQTVYLIPDGLGSAMKVKVLNQLLCGVHIVAGAEIMGLAAVLGLNTRKFYEYVVRKKPNGSRQDCWSWIFEDRVLRSLNEMYMPPSSAASIFVKDMGIVNSEAMKSSPELKLTGASLKLFQEAVDQGLGAEDDSGVVRLFLKSRDKLWKERANSETIVKESTEDEITFLLSETLISIHIIAALEAVSFAERMGMTASKSQMNQWYEIIMGAAGGSTAFENIVPQISHTSEEGLTNAVINFLSADLEAAEKKLNLLEMVIKLAEKRDYKPLLCSISLEVYREMLHLSRK